MIYGEVITLSEIEILVNSEFIVEKKKEIKKSDILSLIKISNTNKFQTKSNNIYDMI